MTKINFYHLTTTPIGKALPRLLEKAIEGENRVIVQASDEAEVEQLNKELWTYTTKVFLPHGAKQDGFCDEQPIYLTANNENPNGAKILAFVNSAEPEEINKFEKVLYMFDGNDETKTQLARKKWAKYKELDFDLTYWKQSTKGKWEQGQ